MNGLKKAICTLFAFALVLKGSAQTNEGSSLQTNLHTYLRAIHTKKGFSGEILLAKGGQVLFQEAIGMASVENGLELKPAAKYRIASLTKSFTATLIAMAEEEGKLNVSDKAMQYCKDLAPKFRHITIHQLLTHTSGLPHNEAIPNYWQIKSKLKMNSSQRMGEINQLELLFQPGSQMSYSSPGYLLLAEILEKVYAKDYSRTLEEKIAKKLQLNGSGTANTLKIIPGMASGYHLVKDDSLVHAPYRNYSLLKGAGDMFATTNDLLKWSNSFLTERLLREKTKERIFTPAVTAGVSEGRLYGYGWYIRDENPKKYFHGGGTWGYSSYIALYPEDSLSLIILSNVSFLPLESIAGDLEKIIWRRHFSMPVAEVEVPLDSSMLPRYSGSFTSASGEMRLTFENSEGRLFARLEGNPAFEIYPKGNHQFFGKKVEILLTFEISKEKVSGLRAERMGQQFYFKKD